jgi:putative flippase GtrA
MTTRNFMKRSDIIAGLVLGEIVAVFLVFILKRLDYFFNLTWLLLIVLPFLTLFALFITYLLSKRSPAIFQFGKYAAVGFANTGVDFGMLNLLMWLTGVYSGKWILILNSISFLVAVTHGYIWNRYWSFRVGGKTDIPKQFIAFFIVTVIGAVIGNGIVYGITTFISPLFGLSVVSWANIAKVIAIAVIFIWNFSGYKFIVFKK